jgi:heterodisulfide reductase subunit A
VDLVRRKSVAVIGGGIAGIQCALDLASVGIKVHLIEKSASIGGHMAMLDKTFPTNDCSMCILAPKMIECFRSLEVSLMTCSEVKEIGGEPGAMRVRVGRRRLEIDEKKCTGCGDCAAVCPVVLPNPFDAGLGVRRAVSKAFAQAVPNVFRVERRGEAPCREKCPAGLMTQAYCALVGEGRFADALRVVLETMPLAGICGRVCPHPCEEACNRREVDEPVALSALKRAAADHGWDAEKPPTAPPLQGLGKKGTVAIVGAGPAGLAAAYDLARMGHGVEIFEASERGGGMLFHGIPAWRLPREILEREIALVLGLGVKLTTGVRVGRDVGLDELREKFDAVFLGVGAHRSLPMKIPGEGSRGVVSAVDFLRRVNAGQDVSVGSRVVVVGGGNAAVDAARAALRLGAGDVAIVYRRTRVEMPALRWEVDAAGEEGVRLTMLASPLEVMEEGGRCTGLRVQRMVLGEPDGSGRRKPVPVPGGEYLIPADTVIGAIGQAPETGGLAFEGRPLDLSGGLLAADPVTMATRARGIFAGGDAVSGPATVIDAVAAGKRAARSIDAFINGAAPEECGKSATPSVGAAQVLEKLDRPPEIRRRVEMAMLPAGKRRRTFDEIEAGLTREQAMEEARRCLACGGCCRCQSCVAACEAKAIDLSRSEAEVTLEVDAVVLAFGFDLMPAGSVPEYGHGRIRDVVTAMELERLLNASGPTAGEVRRPSDGKQPRSIAFIQCVGSRDLRHRHHCSSVCCMHAVKEAMLLREHDAEAVSHVFYMDLRAYGKGFQDYIERARQEYGVRFIRGRPGGVDLREDGRLVVRYEDTAARERRELEADLVVLCNAMIPPAFETDLTQLFGVETTPAGFVRLADPLLSPCATSRPGVFACGFCVGPKDIPDSVVEATAAASGAACLVLGRP